MIIRTSYSNTLTINTITPGTLLFGAKRAVTYVCTEERIREITGEGDGSLG